MSSNGRGLKAKRHPQMADENGNAGPRPINRPAPINTEAARAVNRLTYAAAAASSSGTGSVGDTSSGRRVTPVTAATSLYSTSSGVWSPGPIPGATFSAGMAPKTTWETYMAQDSATHAANQESISEVPHNPPNLPNSAIGLGMQLGKVDVDAGDGTGPKTYKCTGATVDPNWPAVPTRYMYQQVELSNAQNSPFVADSAARAPNTFPIKQQAFGDARAAADQPRIPRELNNPLSQAINHDAATPRDSNVNANGRDNSSKDSHDEDNESFASNRFKKEGTPKVLFTKVTAPTQESSVYSPITAHYTESQPQLMSERPPVFSRTPHRLCWETQTARGQAPIIEAFPDSVLTLSGMNPDYFQMQWGARVVCIKTDFVDNVYCSLRKNVWVTLESVGQRIMRLWEARKDPDDAVIFLISINGQKSYCGMAFMSGPWTAGYEPGDCVDPTDDRTFGTIPVTWTYVKNVSYEKFRAIKNEQNGQPIVNMWNGMHFPYKEGREVMKIYAEAPNFTNVIAYRTDLPYRPREVVVYGALLDPTLDRDGDDAGGWDMLKRPGHSFKKVGAPPARKAIMPANWHGPEQQADEAYNINRTPVASGRRGIVRPNVSTPPPTFDGSASPVPRPTEMVPCVRDANGYYVPVSPHGPSPLRFGGAQHSNHDIMPTQQAFQAYGQQLRAHPQAPFENPRGRGAGPGGYDRGPHGGYGGRGRGQTLMHGATMSNKPHNVPFQRAEAYPLSPTVQRMRSQVGMADPFNGTPRAVRQTLSSATIGLQQETQHLSKKSSKSVFERAASAANFVPQSPVTATNQGMGFFPGMQGGDRSSAGTPDQPRFAYPSTAGGTSSGSPGQYIGGLVPNSGASFGQPSGTRTPVANKMNAGQSARGIIPPVDTTSSHFPGTGHSGATGSPIHGLMTPTGHNMYLTPSDGGPSLSGKSSKAELRGMKMEWIGTLRDGMKLDAQFHRLKYQQAKADARREDGRDSDGWDSGSDESDHDNLPDWQSTSAREKRNISPVRGSHGEILDSISQHTSSDTKARIAAANRHGRQRQWEHLQQDKMKTDRNMELEVEYLVTSPPSSMGNAFSTFTDKAASAGAATANAAVAVHTATNVAATDDTAADDSDDDEVDGGIKLE